MAESQKRDDNLLAEREYFEKNRSDFVEKYLHKFVLIKNQEFHGSFDTLESAYNAGLDEFGNVPMFIRRVEKDDQPEQIPALFFGLLVGNVLAGT